MKPLKLLLLLCLAALSLTGCGLSAKESPEPTASGEINYLLKYINNEEIDEDLSLVISFEEDDGYKYGILNRHTGEEVIPVQYESITYGQNADGALQFLTKSGQDFQLFTREGALIKAIGPYAYIEHASQDMTALFGWVSDTECQVLNSQGDIQFTTDQYDSIRKGFFQDRYLVCRDNLYGITNQEGATVLPRIYESIAQGVKDGEYIVRYQGKFGTVNSENELLIPFDYTNLYRENYTVDGEEREGYHAAIDADEWILDANGKRVLTIE